jgi:hypothetical protein
VQRAFSEKKSVLKWFINGQNEFLTLGRLLFGGFSFAESSFSRSVKNEKRRRENVVFFIRRRILFQEGF